MCDIAGIRSEIIPGYVRTEYYQVGSAGSANHSWNVIYLDSAYYLMDPTRAAGACTKNEEGKLLSYTKEFDEYYWMTPPADFARNHSYAVTDESLYYIDILADYTRIMRFKVVIKK